MALAGAVSLAPSTVLAQSAAAPAAMAAVASPAQFRTTVLTSGAFAMQTSQVALERSPSPRIQEFAQLEINKQVALAAALGAAPGSAPLRPDHAQMELWRKLGDDGGLKAAYRGGCRACQNLSERAIRHEDIYQHCPPSSAR